MNVCGCAHLRIAFAVLYYGMIVGHIIICHLDLVATMMNFMNEPAAVALVMVYHLAAWTSAFGIAMTAVKCGTATRGRGIWAGLVGCDVAGIKGVRVSARCTSSAGEVAQVANPDITNILDILESTRKKHEDGETGSETPHDAGAGVEPWGWRSTGGVKTTWLAD